MTRDNDNDRRPGGPPRGGKPPRRFSATGPRRAGDSGPPRGERPPRRFDGDRPRHDRPRDGRPRDDRPRGERPPGGKSFGSKPYGTKSYGDRPRGDRPDRDRPRPPRDDSAPAFAPEAAPVPAEPERIAKVMARAGVASRRDCETLIAEGRVTLNGERIDTPATLVSQSDAITVDGEPLPHRERTRLFLYHKPAGLVTTFRDPEGRPTVFDNLPEDLPRVVSIGRLDINTEGLLLLTNDGGLSRVLAHPLTAWLRKYRVRAHGEVTQAQLNSLREGLVIDGVRYGPIEAELDREQGANVWLTLGLREGKNREIKRVLDHLGLTVNRLIRLSFGPFQLGELPPGEAIEVRTRVLRDQLGPDLADEAGVDFDGPIGEDNRVGGRPAYARERDERGGFAPREERGPPRRYERDERGPPRRFDEERPARGGSGSRDERPERRDARAPVTSRGPRHVWREDFSADGPKPRPARPRRDEATPAQESRPIERSEPIADRKGRRVKVERVKSQRPDDGGPAMLPPGEVRLIRPTQRERDRESGFGDRSREERRDAYRGARAPSGEDRPRRPRPQEGGGARPPGDRPYADRPPRREGEGFRPRGEGRPGGKPGGYGGGKPGGRPGGRPSGKPPGKPGGRPPRRDG